MKSKIFQICKYLRTRYASKNHGGYDIYEDAKIFLACDTYAPNVDVYVKLPDGTQELVLSNSQVYHPGEWENYILKIYKNVPHAKKQYEKDEIEKEKQRHESNYGICSKKLNDVFSEK